MEVPNYRCQVLLIFYYVLVSFVASECAPGVSTPGVTVPNGDIVMEYGQDLEIFCILNETVMKENHYRYNASYLYFSYDNQTVHEDYVHVVNETTARLFMRKPPAMKKVIMCKLRFPNATNTGVCLNFVSIGYKPMAPKNFSCISYNWENMNCTWEPQPHYVKTTYNISFQLRMNKQRVFYCPNPKTLSRNYCVWNAGTYPPYRMVWPYYHFTLTGTNQFGSTPYHYDIDHYSVVIPHKPLNLTLIEATSSSLTITWAIPSVLRNFPPGIVNKIMYQSEWDPMNFWQTIHPKNSELINGSNGVLTYNITGLKYACALYDIRVLIRSAPANDSYWSEPATTTRHTKPTVPGAPPKTDIGSFETRNPTSSREVYIYWQQIPRYMENGENFEYKIIRIVEFNDSSEFEVNIKPSSITKTYARFPKLSLNSYKFTLISSNKEGVSRDVSHIVIPSLQKSLSEPVQFSKIAYDHGIYQLSWKIAPNVSSYTVFWCDNKQDRPYECKGMLNWTRVEVGVDVVGKFGLINVTLPVDKVYQFALSANTETSSSGMVWASCTVLPDQAIGKLKNVWINRIGATYMEVSWKLDCIRIIEGFQISYCPIRDPLDSSCKEPFKNVTIKGDAMTSQGNITGLKPYTTYMVYVAVVSGNLTGLKSDPKLNTTLEAAPDSPPTDLSMLEVTNTTIKLSWVPPPSLNGALRYYLIYFNNNVTRDSRSNVVQATLTDLRSYEWYTIKVQACTNACSPNSTTIRVQTRVGRPGKMDTPKLRFINGTERSVHVEWVRPAFSGGPINFYYVRLRISDSNTISIERVYNTTGMNMTIPTPECQQVGSPQYYSVDVKAVNIGWDDSLLDGSWSTPGEGNCYAASYVMAFRYLILTITVGLLSLIVICGAVAYTMHCLWLRYKAMQNIGVKLPPQLELNNVVLQFKDKVVDLPMNSHVCSPQLKPIDDTMDAPPPDQQLLLDKKDKYDLIESSNDDCEEGNVDRESSGCGSGHDSVSSSITAGTHITDSGTETDECKYLQNVAAIGQRPPSPDVFSESPRRFPDLRQRNISLSGSGGEGYSRLAPAPTSTGYVTVPPNFSRGYVSHPQSWGQSSPSKGYVAVGPAPIMNSSMYSIVGLRPNDSVKAYKDCNFMGSNRSPFSADSPTSDDNHFTIIPTNGN